VDRAVGYVHCEPGFAQNAQVVNGFSDLIVGLWGDAGRHARSAPGQGPSPLNVPFIVDAIVAVEYTAVDQATADTARSNRPAHRDSGSATALRGEPS
jgi:hypothetical protein